MLLLVLLGQALYWWGPKYERKILDVSSPAVQPASHTDNIMTFGYSELPSVVVLDIVEPNPLAIERETTYS